MNLADLQPLIDRAWDEDLVPRLTEYVRVPAKSPAFDPSWQAHGHLARVVADGAAWARAQGIAGLTVDTVAIEGRTPCIVFDAPATATGSDRTVLFYAHLDKQPEMSGWRAGLGPWTPVLEDGRLYGRGAADDGYGLYAALTILRTLDALGVARPRCVGLIETCEESGSHDLPAYLELLGPRLGAVGLVVCLDSGCGDYERLWITTSLRGLAGGTLNVEVLTEGVHSGLASGLVPSSFRIARQLLNRIDDPQTGQVLDPAFHAPIPTERLQQARAAAAILGEAVWTEFPWAGCQHGPDGHLRCQPTRFDPFEGLLARTWWPALSVTGAAGLPGLDAAGNVLRPKTALKLSLRLPPGVDGEAATAALKALLERDPPYQAVVRFDADWGASGWNAPPTAPWLAQAADEASRAAFGSAAAWLGCGGTIPFMNLLGLRFPQAQFLTVGVLGPQSNAHGPNEFLHLDYARRLSAAVAAIVAAARLD